jgi:hypothetical protein
MLVVMPPGSDGIVRLSSDARAVGGASSNGTVGGTVNSLSLAMVQCAWHCLLLVVTRH